MEYSLLFPKLYISQGILFTGHKDQKLSVAVGNQFDSCEEFDPWDYNPLTHVHEYERTGRTHILTLGEAVRGRYVTVYLNKTGALQLCEVEVCAKPVSPGEQNISYIKVPFLNYKTYSPPSSVPITLGN